MLVFCVLLVGLITAPVVPSLAQERDRPVPPSGTKCPPVPGRNETCVCKTDKGIIDLTPVSNSDGTPKFTGMVDGNDFSYTYNPCKPFQKQGENGCDKTHICQSPNNDPNQFFDIADPGTEVMYIDTDGSPYIYYTGPGNRDTRVYLTCDKSADTPVATTDGDTTTSLSYVFHIIAKESCPIGKGDQSYYVPIGEVGIGIICGILPCAVIVYIVVGIVIMKYHFKATGSDVIPNKQFWTAFPLLVKDGCVFTFSPITRLIKGKVAEKKGYDSIDKE